MFAVLYAIDGSGLEALAAVAREFSPRIEVCDPPLHHFGGARAPADEGETRASEVVLDISGIARLFGAPREIGMALHRTAVDRGLSVRVAIAGTRTAARLLVHAEPARHVTVIEPGTEAASLAPLPIDRLAVVAATRAPSHSGTLGPSPPRTAAPSPAVFRRWGLRTLGDLAALPSDALAARLGQQGVQWQRLARGEDPRPLLPAAPEERFEQALDLEWPIEGLEPLSFVLGRLMDPLAAHLERRGRGAAVLHVRLHLVTRVIHERSLQLPAPLRDPRTLRTLALLDLESHPPSAAIDRVVVAVDPTPGRIVQFSLLTRPLPSPEQLSTLMARLAALMGEGRCGSPVEVNSWRPGAFAMQPFAPRDSDGIDRHGPQRHRDTESGGVIALRRFRYPVAARVRVEQGRPVRVVTDHRGLSGGAVQTCAGPWRIAGDWWAEGQREQGGQGRPSVALNPRTPPALPTPPSWDRDEWDATVADGTTYRLFRERATDAWFIEGIVD